MSMTPYTFDLEPGETKHQTFGEANFIFVDFADRTLEVSINGSWQTLRKGTKFKSRTGMFDQFEIRNPDPNNPCRVIMFIGTDEIENLIVEGEISIEPILRNADGTTKADTRQDLQLSLNPYNLTITNYQAGDIIRQTSGTLSIANGFQADWLIPHPDGRLWNIYIGNNDAYNTFTWDPKTGLFLEELTTYDLRFAPGNGARGVWFNDAGQLFYVGADGAAFLCNPSGSGVSFVSQGVTLEKDGSTISKVCTDFDAGVLYALQSNSQVLVYNLETLAFIREFTLGHSAGSIGGLFFDPVRGQLVAASIGNTWRFLDPADGALVDSVPANFTIYDSSPSQWFYGEGNEVFRTSAGGTTATLTKQALVDFVTKPEFFAVRPGCEALAALRNFVPVQTTAQISVSTTLNGVIVSGEVIKAALEFYFGRAMPDDYLDHVYLVDSSQDKFKPISSGNSTFRRAGIADDFEIRTPTNLVLRIDSELTPGELL